MQKLNIYGKSLRRMCTICTHNLTTFLYTFTECVFIMYVLKNDFLWNDFFWYYILPNVYKMYQDLYYLLNTFFVVDSTFRPTQSCPTQGLYYDYLCW